MGSSNRNHHRNLQVAVVVAVDQNFLIFGGRSLKSRLRLRWCMGRSDQILLVVPEFRVEVRHCYYQRTAIQLRKIEQISCGVCGQTANRNRNLDLAADCGCG